MNANSNFGELHVLGRDATGSGVAIPFMGFDDLFALVWRCHKGASPRLHPGLSLCRRSIGAGGELLRCRRPGHRFPAPTLDPTTSLINFQNTVTQPRLRLR